jgi:hypothetical protein
MKVLMHALAASCEELRARTGNPPLLWAGCRFECHFWVKIIQHLVELCLTLLNISTKFHLFSWRKPFSSPEPFSLGHSLKIRLWVRRLKGEIWLASQRTAISQKLSNFRWENFFYQNMSTQTLRFFVILACEKFSTRKGVEASQFKSTYEGRARPWGPGNQDGRKQKETINILNTANWICCFLLVPGLLLTVKSTVGTGWPIYIAMTGQNYGACGALMTSYWKW